MFRRPLGVNALATATAVAVLFVISRSALTLLSSDTSSVSDTDRKDYEAYRRIIVGAGEPCDEVTRTYLVGSTKDGTVLISVLCAGSHRYQLSESRESTKVLSCDVLERIALTRCFEKLN
jgi:hypothetical protein